MDLISTYSVGTSSFHIFSADTEVSGCIFKNNMYLFSCQLALILPWLPSIHPERRMTQQPREQIQVSHTVLQR